MSSKLSRTFASLLVALAIAFAGVTLAAAQPPTNDDFDNAALIPALPFSAAISLSEATIADDDPLTTCNDSHTPSLWYSFTPTVDMTVEANTWYFDSVPVLSVFTGSRGDLTEIGCNYYEPSLTLGLTGGTTYYFLITSLWETGGDLTLSVTEVVPPPNDDFDTATVVSGLPFTATINTRLATNALDDPPHCSGYSPPGSVWYSFTTTQDVRLEIHTYGSTYYTLLSVFTGSRGALTEIACGSERIVFVATRDTTYYFMVIGEGAGNLTLSVQEYVPAPLEPGMWFGPYDASAFDSVSFCDDSYDPDGLVSPSWFTWDFGDGTSVAGEEYYCAYHQYAADGDYTVQHSATFTDDRSVSISQVVQVRTHDVAIKKFSAPTAAKAGQTRSITVFVNNKRYDETVSISLYKSAPGGMIAIDYAVQLVPVSVANRTTAFTFPYTFTDDDARAGKVTFWASAAILDENGWQVRDALPGDNDAISSPPTRVIR
jgi:hypothetical protein